MISATYAMDSQIKAQDLASTILSSSSPPQISTACSAVECFLQKHVPDQTRSFFSITFPALICKIFGFDDSSSPQKSPSSGGWIDQISAANDTGLSSKIFDLLSPSGVLLSSIFAVDRHSLVKYVFPVERLPEWARFLLQNERDCRILPDLCPLFSGRIKEDPIQGSFQVQLNVFEYYMFWFAYYPVCKGNCEGSADVVVRKNRLFKLEKWTSSLPGLVSTARGSGQKTDHGLYARLLYAYLHAFVPFFGLNSYQPYRSSLLHYSSVCDGSILLQAEFLVYTFIHFWLDDNDFSPLPLNVCRSFGVSFPLRSVLGETPPAAGLGEVVKLLVKYLNAGMVVGKSADIMDQNRALNGRLLGSADPLKSRASGLHFACGNSAGSWNILMQRPLYRFILRTFLFCPVGASIKNASQVFSVWITYLEPWKISLEDFAEFDIMECRSSNTSRNESSQCLGKMNFIDSGSKTEGLSHWEGYVVSNYLFYSSLVVHFLGFAHKFLHTNAETVIQMVQKVLNILTSSRELMELLKKIDAAYHSKPSGSSSAVLESAYKCVPLIREQLQDWEDGLCESDADGSFLHENWNNDLKLFSKGEDGGQQLLQLLILRAEHEIHAISGDNMAKNLQTTDSIKVKMGGLFGDLVGNPTSVTPEPKHGRDEVFTPKHPGIGRRTWADVKYKGDWMRRPISDSEVAWLARLLIWLSVWLNEALGLNGVENVATVPACDYADVPGDDMDHVGGLKEALLTLLSSVGLWLVFLGQMVLRFMREHGLRINLRSLASKNILMLLILSAVFCALKKAWRVYLHPSAFCASPIQ